MTSAHVQPVLQDMCCNNCCRTARHNLQDFVRSMWLFLCYEVVDLSYGISDTIETGITLKAVCVITYFLLTLLMLSL